MIDLCINSLGHWPPRYLSYTDLKIKLVAIVLSSKKNGSTVKVQKLGKKCAKDLLFQIHVGSFLRCRQRSNANR
jgi:hypothetical protein